MEDNEIKKKNLDIKLDQHNNEVETRDNKNTKKPKTEINFETYLKEKKSKVDELKNFFENPKNDTDNQFINLPAITYNDDDERTEVIKKLINLYVPSKKVKLSNFFCSNTTNDDIDNEIFQKNKSIFLDILKLYVNLMVDTVHWLKIEHILKLIEAVENFKPQQLSEKKIISNSLYFINKSDYVFTFRELFQPLKKQVQQLNASCSSNESTILNLKEIIDKKNDELVQLNHMKLEFEKEKVELEHNIGTLKLKGDAKQAGSWQEKNEIIGRVQNKLTSFLNYELHIATEAVLNGDQGAIKASKMIEKLTAKIKEEKEWLSSLD